MVKARNGALKEIKEAATGVSSRLTEATEALPGWKDTLNVMSGLFKLVDLVVFVAFGTSTDQKIAEALGSLHKIGKEVLSAMR